MSRGSNKLRSKYAVTFVPRKTTQPLDELDRFIAWTHEQNLKSYIVIGELLGISPSKANRLLCRSILPDGKILKRMRELMA